jgi:Arc/MetJ family transcription regulator
MIILVIISVIFLVLLAGLLLAFLFTRADRAVTTVRVDMAAEERAYNPGMTLGHKIKVESDYEEQLKQARLLAAKKAAELPRGANNRIGRAGQSTLATAGQSAKSDPMTAVRIARFHGWDGVRTGAPSVGAAAVPSAAVAAAPGSAPAAVGIAPPKLIAITPDMPPEEVRKARIANSKAEAAYNKALKAAAAGAPAPAPAGVAVAQPADATVAAPSAAHIEPPKLIEITPGMAPEEVRKARVANAKAEAAYSKALKAAGAAVGGASGAHPATAIGAATDVTQPAAAAPSAAPVATGIAPPQLIEITEGMAPEEVRRARVANAKAESAYNKALKAAGIDPSTVKAGAIAAAAPIPSAPREPEMPTVSTAPAATAAPTVPAGITPPQLIEITDDMVPEDIRRARVANAKATAAYNKALKAAGIDPASVK